MIQLLVVGVIALVAIAGTTLLGPRLGIASPLLLVAIGVIATFVPAVGQVPIEPEWILQGVLPPLLYSSAVSMPSMNFRREFGAISGLSVLLVVATSLVLGVFFMLALPELGFAWGVAIGAILSPTDAVATSIIKRTGVSQRVVALLDGESLLNDATALVLLRTAIVATASGFSFGSATGSFAYSVAVAVLIGGAVGILTLRVRKRITNPTAGTVISFTVPFLASVPVELLGASGLVAAVVAGIVIGVRAPRDLSPQSRLADAQNWRTIELVLEGFVFLTMGLQIPPAIEAVAKEHAGIPLAMLIALSALGITVLVRALYVAPLLGVLRWRARNALAMKPRVEELQQRMSTPEGKQETLARMSERGRGRLPSDRDMDRFSRRLTMSLANVEYFRRQPMGWREGTAVVWAGMRGAVTVAAAQTLPDDAPQRDVILLIAFAVAVLSLVVQGLTIGPLVKRLTPERDAEAAKAEADAERTRVFELLRSSGESVPEPPHPEGAPTLETWESSKRWRLEVLAAQRAALLDARDNGTFDADVLERVLATLDASQIDLEMRGDPVAGV